MSQFEQQPSDARPKQTYVQLIRTAILDSPRQALTLQEIYDSIETKHPFFTTAKTGWKNTTRHCLSLNPCFVNAARPFPLPGKGGYWTVDLTQPESFTRKRAKALKQAKVDTDSGSRSRSPPPASKRAAAGAPRSRKARKSSYESPSANRPEISRDNGRRVAKRESSYDEDGEHEHDDGEGSDGLGQRRSLDGASVGSGGAEGSRPSSRATSQGRRIGDGGFGLGGPPPPHQSSIGPSSHHYPGPPPQHQHQPPHLQQSYPMHPYAPSAHQHHQQNLPSYPSSYPSHPQHHHQPQYSQHPYPPPDQNPGGYYPSSHHQQHPQHQQHPSYPPSTPSYPQYPSHHQQQLHHPQHDPYGNQHNHLPPPSFSYQNGRALPPPNSYQNQQQGPPGQQPDLSKSPLPNSLSSLMNHPSGGPPVLPPLGGPIPGRPVSLHAGGDERAPSPRTMLPSHQQQQQRPGPNAYPSYPVPDRTHSPHHGPPPPAPNPYTSYAPPSWQPGHPGAESAGGWSSYVPPRGVAGRMSGAREEEMPLPRGYGGPPPQGAYGGGAGVPAYGEREREIREEVGQRRSFEGPGGVEGRGQEGEEDGEGEEEEEEGGVDEKRGGP